jgi:hypothetical protein
MEETMFEKNDVLKKLIEAHTSYEPSKVTQIYLCLQRYAPTVMEDPTLGWAWIDHVLSNTPHGAGSYQALLPAAERVATLERHMQELGLGKK